MDQVQKKAAIKGFAGLLGVAVNAYLWLAMIKIGVVSLAVGITLMSVPVGVFIVWVIFTFFGTWAGWTVVSLAPAYALWESYWIIPPTDFLGWLLRSVLVVVLVFVWASYTIRRYQQGGLKALFGF
ncbi:hypothetical protein HYT05_01955 [Candidatus Kaiserbacteria bacterium]|nr:hypothetical protein [Candidatus Kaiserbacteria bacterium]